MEEKGRGKEKRKEQEKMGVQIKNWQFQQRRNERKNEKGTFAVSG